MTTKSTGKGPQQRQQPVGPTQEDVRTAYQVHTLAQVLYGHLATTHPWIHPTPIMPGYDPRMTMPTNPPPIRGWPGMWGHPYGWPR